MLHKSFEPLDTKVDAEAGTFEATVAVFNNVDKGGDRIMPGAFEKSLAAWKASGDPIPVIFNHDWGTPDAHIGVLEEAAETTNGLYVKGRLDVADNPVARQVHRLMQRRSLKEFSFGYSVPKGGEKRAKDGANDLLQIDLAEVGPTLKGMNPATELHAVKSAVEAAAAGRTALEQELEETKSKLAEAERDLEALKKNADETDKGSETRSVDPLRKRSEELALEVASGGLSLRKPPNPVEEPEPELIPLRELKQRSRDLMLQVLSGTE